MIQKPAHVLDGQSLLSRHVVGFVAAATVVLMPYSAAADSGAKPTAVEAGAQTVEAQYALHFNGIKVGRFDMASKLKGKAYTLTSSASVSVLFGAFKYAGTASATGTIDNGQPQPSSYGVEWHANKKAATTRIAFKDNRAIDIKIDPPPKLKHDTVPLTPTHSSQAIDPISAVLAMTTAIDRAPCDRRLAIFDGHQRYDIVMSFKRTMQLPQVIGGQTPSVGHVCRIVYEPIAGHRDNADTRAYVANRNVEIVMRAVPAFRVYVPHSITIPTEWGMGSMTMTHVQITGPTGVKIALSE